MDELLNQEENATAEGSSPCAKCEDYLAGWKRAQADYQNLKKASEQERAEFAKYANERLIHELLPAIDQFALALQFIPATDDLPEDQRKKWENWLLGIKAVQAHWERVTASVGLERIGAQGMFDPALHDAVGEEAAEGSAPGTILRITQDGWKLHGKVLRHAKVIIAT